MPALPLSWAIASRLQQRISHLVLLGSPAPAMVAMMTSGEMLSPSTVARSSVADAGARALQLLDPDCTVPACGCPYTDDLRRPLQPQQAGFGAGGPHFCLGANLARREISVMFDQIRTRLPEMRITGEPDWLQSNFINGIKHLPCAWS